MEDRIREADIIVANPPFESKAAASETINPDDDLSPISRAAEMLRRIANAARPGTLVGFVMPQTLLDSSKVTSLRATLHRDFEWKEILRLPDKNVFKMADVESAILIGRRLPAGKSSPSRIATTFKNIAEDEVVAFVKTGTSTITQSRFMHAVGAAPEYSMLLPDLADIWEYFSGKGTLGDVAKIGQGFSFKSRTNSVFTKDCGQFSHKKCPGFSLGFYNLDNAPHTHLLPQTRWLNRDVDAIMAQRTGYAAGNPQVVMNLHPSKRGAWRIPASS
jgi:N-6 DNA Methylase